jgi:hypothetical protein
VFRIEDIRTSRRKKIVFGAKEELLQRDEQS